MIILNPQYEAIFDPRNIDEDCNKIADEIVCHDDEMTLGSGSFSGISQQLLKRW